MRSLAAFALALALGVSVFAAPDKTVSTTPDRPILELADKTVSTTPDRPILEFADKTVSTTPDRPILELV